MYVNSPEDAPKHTVLEIADKERGGPEGQRFAWYQCTVKGGREGRDIDAMTLAKVRVFGVNDFGFWCLLFLGANEFDFVSISTSFLIFV